MSRPKTAARDQAPARGSHALDLPAFAGNRLPLMNTQHAEHLQQGDLAHAQKVEIRFKKPGCVLDAYTFERQMFYQSVAIIHRVGRHEIALTPVPGQETPPGFEQEKITLCYVERAPALKQGGVEDHAWALAATVYLAHAAGAQEHVQPIGVGVGCLPATGKTDVPRLCQTGIDLRQCGDGELRGLG